MPHNPRYAFFPGCLDDNVTREQYVATKKVAEKIGIKLFEFPEFSCCGSGVVRDANEFAELALNARNFAIADEKDLDIMTTCSTCLMTMSRAKARLDSDKKLKSEINEQLAEFGLLYSGKIWVKHWLWVLADEITLKPLIVKPLDKLRVAPFYGCHLLRPSKFLWKQEPNNPQTFEKLIETLGAKPIEFPEKKDCCGFHSLFSNELNSLKLSGKILGGAEKRADCIVTACPHCHFMLDALQTEARKASGLNEKNLLPIIHLSQLMGLALGIPAKQLSLDNNISTEKLLSKI